MARWTSQNTTIRIEGAAGVGLTVGPGAGDFNVDGLEAGHKERVQKMDRGTHDGWVETNDKTNAWSINVELRNETLTSAAAARLMDLLLGTGIYAPAGLTPVTSTSSCTYALKLIATMNDGTTTTTLTLPEIVSGQAFAEGPEGHTLAISGLNALAPVFA